MKHQPPQNPATVNDVLELAFHHNGSYSNPFLDAGVEVDFQDPDGRSTTRKGFYHSADVWAVRSRPDRAGDWKYRFRFSSGGHVIQAGEGEFRTIPATNATEIQGPIQVNPRNPYRWTFQNGQPYFPVGLQDCVELGPDNHLGSFGVDGGDQRDHTGRNVSAEEYFALYGQAGFNLLRFSQRNCSYSLYDELDHYKVTTSLATDELMKTARSEGFRVMFGFFGYHDAWNPGPTQHALAYLREKLGILNEALFKPEDTKTLQKEERFVDYCVARWGVYADFWELLNERQASAEWTRQIARHVQMVDPDRKLVTTSWEKPQMPEIGINAPHWYESESEKDSDRRVQQLSVTWKRFPKPVLVGEQGNMGMNWDPLSATRMRIRTWTALFEEIGIVFWNTSWSKAGMNHGVSNPRAVSNIYLGPEERGYIAGLQGFARLLDADVNMAPVKVSDSESVRGYGLVSPNVAAVYLHHFADHTVPIKGLDVEIALPPQSNLQYAWIDPATGTLLAQGVVRAGQKTLVAPPFLIDLALLVNRNGVPKIVSLTH